MSADLRLRIVAARAVNRGNLVAAVDVQFGGLEVRDLTVLRGPYGVFIAMPRRPRVDQVGRQMRGDDGKLLYDGPLIRWVDSGTAQKFQQALLTALRRGYPGILNGEADHHPQDDARLLLDGHAGAAPAPTRARAPRTPYKRQRPPGRPWRAESGPPLPDDPLDDVGRGEGTS